MTFSEWIDLATIFVSISLGLLAWKQTNRQIKLSNKHALYEKRLAAYVVIKDIQKVQQEIEQIQLDKTIPSDQKLKNIALKARRIRIFQGLDWQGFFYDKESWSQCIQALRELESLPESIPLLFFEKNTKEIAQYVSYYHELVMRLLLIEKECFSSSRENNLNNEKKELYLYIEKFLSVGTQIDIDVLYEQIELVSVHRSKILWKKLKQFNLKLKREK